MKYSELTLESAADELARELPSLKKHDYTTIDKLMQRISTRHKITGKKLHDIFVKKYGNTPDHWIQKYKNKLKEDPTDELPDFTDVATNVMQSASNISPEITEAVDGKNDIQKIKNFINWTAKKLHCERPLPKIVLSRNTKEAQAGHHTGRHTEGPNKEIWVYIGNRNLIDIFRTIFHELVHERQSQLNMIRPGSSYPGSPIEAMADMLAGKYIKIYGEEHPDIFQ